MEAHQQIKQWLNSGQDYAQGLVLAKAHGLAERQLRLLESGQNAFTQDKLRTALQKVLDTLSSQVAAPAPRASTAPQLVVATPAPLAAPESPELLELRRQRTATFKQAVHHQGQMRAAAPGPARLVHAVAIKRLFRENARLWAAEDYYKEFGFLPAATADVATLDRTDLRAVEKRRNTLRTYVSSAKAGNRAKSDPTKVAAWKAELLELDLLLTHE